MNTSLIPLEFPWMTEFGKTVDEASATGTAVVLSGDGTSGKRHTIDLQVQRILDKRDDIALHIRLKSESDLIKHIRNVIDDITPWSVPKDWRRNSVGRMAGLLRTRLEIRGVSLLMFSNCQVIDHTFYEVIFDVLAEFRRRGQKFGLVLAGRGQTSDFLSETRAHQGYVRQYVRVPEMVVGDVMAALNDWCRAEKFTKKAEGGDVQAQDAIEMIRAGTGGNIGRLATFAQVKNLRFAKRDFNEALVEEVFDSLRHPDPEK